MKHFEKNALSGADLIDLHETLVKAFGPLAHNLFFHEAVDEADAKAHREKLARSAYNVIAVCEAVIDRVPEEEAARALEECREHFDPDRDEVEEMAEKLMALIFGRL